MFFLVVVALSHLLVVIGNSVSFFILPFMVEWYIALPLDSFILWVTFSPGPSCPLTKLENKIRRRLELEPIGGFIKHYLIKKKFNEWAIMDEITEVLNKIEELDPYWQKFEWIKLSQDSPELFHKVLAYKRERGDIDV